MKLNKLLFFVLMGVAICVLPIACDKDEKPTGVTAKNEKTEKQEKAEKEKATEIIKDKTITVAVAPVMTRLLQEEDIDGDDRITIDDEPQGMGKGDKSFKFDDVEGNRWTIEGNHHLSNLLQELAIANQAGMDKAEVDLGHVYEDPVERISRMVREVYWDSLTKAVDEEHMPDILSDPKTETADGKNYIYVPHSDARALEYFKNVASRHPEWKLEVVRLPEKITPEYVRGLNGKHGILSLKLEEGEDGKLHGVPFVVPGGRFNEMYGWDSYFIVLGLIEDGKVELARSMVDNHVYQIEHYGKILNANRSYYLTRSQPPFLSSMARAVYEALPEGDDREAWANEVAAAVEKEYKEVWTSPPRLQEKGLSRYYGEGIGPCPEVEPGHYDPVIRPYAEKAGMTPDQYLKKYKTGDIKNEELDEFFVHDRAVRESGHDTTYRFDGRAADFLTVDLNALLYKYEKDLLAFTGNAQYLSSSERRKSLVLGFLWSSKLGMYSDYDMNSKKTSDYASATVFYPMWAGMAGDPRADIVVKNALPLLEQAGGLAASSEESRGPITEDRPQRQWDYPYGWPPHQMMAWRALRDYGFTVEAERLTYKWLYTIVKNAADYNGTVPEKFEVVDRTHKVFAEYGNVGTEFSYITKEGFGWMNASFVVGLAELDPELVEKLKELVPPEEIFGPSPTK